MATQAIMEGFEETLWIDADMVFDVGAVEQIRFHHHPIVAGLYSKRGGRALTSVFSKAIGGNNCNTGAMHLTERVWGVRMRFLGNSAVFFAFDGSDNDATSESGGDLCGR
jgi:hypothetical protein